MTDALRIAQDLIRCQSVTPAEGGALTLIEKLLAPHGFICHRLKFSDANTPDVDNLYARWGTGAPHICFAGHTDVVPVGDAKAWTSDPFGGEIIDGNLCGRGASDMKGAIAAFISAALDYIAREKPQGSISFLITGDEEGPSVNGTRKVLDWMEARGETLDFCIVGEPTAEVASGDMIKIGRRGSFSGYITVQGVQGHVAYPQLADNPIPKLMKLLTAIDGLVLDGGNDYFQPSNLEIVNIEVSGGADNVIPAWGRGFYNVRFNNTWTAETLEKKLRETLDGVGVPYEMKTRCSGESFYTPPGVHSDMVVAAVRAATGREPKVSTTGGISDARFIRKYCAVVECGVSNATAHKVDERVPAADITALKDIYAALLARFFTA